MTGAPRPSRASLDAAEDALWERASHGPLPALSGDGVELAVARAVGDHGLVARVPVSAVQHERWGELRAVIRLFDEAPRRVGDTFRASWRAVLLAWNLLQFHPRVSVISSEQDRATQRDLLRVALAAGEAPKVDDRWAAVFDLVDGSCEALARALLAAGAPAPVVGEDVTHGGRVVATAELAWPEARVGVFLDGATAAGWTVFEPTADAGAVFAAVTGRSDGD